MPIPQKPSDVIKERFYKCGNIYSSDNIEQFPAYFIVLLLNYLDETHEQKYGK